MSGCLFIFLFLAKRPFAKIEVAQKREEGEREWQLRPRPVSGQMGRNEVPVRPSVGVGAKSYFHPSSSAAGHGLAWEPSYQRPAALPSGALPPQPKGGKPVYQKEPELPAAILAGGRQRTGAWMLAQQGRLRTVFLLPPES